MYHIDQIYVYLCYVFTDNYADLIDHLKNEPKIYDVDNQKLCGVIE